MKRLFSIFTALVLLCVLLCACGKIQSVEKLIDKIGEVTIDSGPQIEAAEQAISTLDADQVKKISNLDLLDDAKLKYENILEEKEENDKKIERVEKKIQNIKTVTEESGNIINTAREAFDRLAPELQGAVSNKDTLSEAEETFEQLAIQTATDAIDQIGTVSLDNEDAIIAAEIIYNKFDESIQQKIENRDVLFAAEETLIQLKVDRAQSAIDAIGNVTLDSKNAIDVAKEAFNSIPTDARDKVKNRDDLTKAKDSYAALMYEQKRQEEIDEARKLIHVTKVAVSAPDSAGGVELYFNFINESEKTIKYVYFSVTFYNAVGDVVNGQYNYGTVNYCKDTGPFATGEGRTGTWWHWGDFYNWDIASVKLVDLSIEYTDGTTVTLTKDQVAGVQY